MRFALFLTLSLSLLAVCHAQVGAADATPAPAKVASPGNADADRTDVVERRTKRIHIEDAGASIDELRIGGETRRIGVQPKGGMPAYQIAPASGERSWKILGF
jgi:hypothetical protein